MSRWGADARAWRATLGDLLAREEEATHLRLQLQSHEEEALGLKAQLQQLRRVNLDLERRR